MSGTLRDDTVLLREWRLEDAPTLAEVSGEEAVCRFTTVPREYSPAAARAWVERQREHRGAGTGVVLAVTLGENRPPVGNVNLVGLSDDGSEASVGYWMTPAMRGRGLASRAVRLLCDWGFDELGLSRIEFAILPGNTASQRLAERLGATFEGLRRASHRADGRDWDMLIYSLKEGKANVEARDESKRQDRVWWQGGLMEIKARAEDTGGAVGVLEGRFLEEGYGPPLHVHSREDEAVYVIEGRVRFRVGDDEFVAGPGSWVWQPRGVPQSFRVESEGARVLLVFTPAGMERMFEEGGVPAGESAEPPEQEADPKAAAAFGQRFGFEFIGPQVA